MKKPSPQTELRNLTTRYNGLARLQSSTQRLMDEYRVRATKAEQEAQDWKKRFDLLLKRLPEDQL